MRCSTLFHIRTTSGTNCSAVTPAKIMTSYQNSVMVNNNLPLFESRVLDLPLCNSSMKLVQFVYQWVQVMNVV